MTCIRRGVRRICWRNNRSCAPTPCCRCSTARVRGRVVRRSSSSRTTPTRSPDGRPSLDWGADVDLPHEVLEQLRPTASVYAITVRNGVIIDAPGQLDLGRETRLANRAQRRAFKGLYTTCAVPGCCVRYSRTKLHHIIWWRHGGRTDLDESDSVVRDPSPEGPPRRLDHHAGSEPRTHCHPAGRTSHDHRPTQTRRGMIGVGTEADADHCTYRVRSIREHAYHHRTGDFVVDSYASRTLRGRSRPVS